MPADPRFEAYFAKAAPFAQPIMAHLRALVRAAVPEAEETVKWGMPHFVYKGKNLAGIGAFKAHVAFVLHGQGRQGKEAEAMGQYGKIAALSDLPADAELTANILHGKAEIDNPVKTAKPKSAPKAEIAMPEDFAKALAAMQGVQGRFDAMPPGARREYLEWITGAKRPETRSSRIAKACDQIAEGKKLNWKYENC